VLARFRDASLGRVSDRFSADLVCKTLELIFALQPFNTEAPQLRETAAKFIGISSSDFVRTVDELENAGVLLRGGYTCASSRTFSPAIFSALLPDFDRAVERLRQRTP
jgi:hypothetical protein